MKNFLFILATTFSLVSFAAQKNPQIRTCHTLGGEFVAAQIPHDEVGLCKFDQALIGANDLVLFENKESISQSISNYLKSNTSCEPNGQITTAVVLGGLSSIQFCSYADGSMIDLSTLIKGQNSADNQKLNEALGLY